MAAPGNGTAGGAPVVSLDQVWKRYRLGARRKGHVKRRTLAGEITLSLERAGLRKSAEPIKHLWALADASFEIHEGESVGIIGPNGSGKSTALKLISNITLPWSGTVRTRGRVGSLIEIKSGIHPELTGRENIFLYGSILGLSRRDIRTRFDEIVEFAELGRFIDTPTKRYSSGMEVRLGFSVAVHLEPDVLLVDEVLAVGDESFQRRCLKRMDELRANGQTLVFVSHILPDVRRLCPRVIYLDRAMVRADGPAEEVLQLYLADVHSRQLTAESNGDGAPGAGAPGAGAPAS
jgi:ABC-type polysaccharide/polyol phosphate transport system ATPase subunit